MVIFHSYVSLPEGKLGNFMQFLRMRHVWTRPWFQVGIRKTGLSRNEWGYSSWYTIIPESFLVQNGGLPRNEGSNQWNKGHL